MKSPRFEVLLNFVAKTQATFTLPRIVYDELEANYRRELRTRLSKFIAARDQLRGMQLSAELPRVELDIEGATAAYLTRVLGTLGLKTGEIVGYRDGWLGDVMRRAVDRRRPCNDHGEEIRDAVLWNAVMSIATDADETVVFVSKNTRQFGEESLHPALAKEVEEQGLRIDYFTSLEEFGRRHATRIDFITDEWISEHLDPDTIFEQAEEDLVNSLDHGRSRSWSRIERPSGPYILSFRYLEVDEFYVYELQPDAYRFHASWIGRAEARYEVEVEEEVEVEDWDLDYDDDGLSYRPRLRHRWRTNTREQEAEVRLHVTTDLLIRDGKVESWSISEASAEFD